MINSAIWLFILSRFHQFETGEIDVPDSACGGFNGSLGGVRIDIRKLFVFSNSFLKAVGTTVGSKMDGGFVDHAFAKKPYLPRVG